MRRRCQFCANLSISSLVDLAKTEFSGREFPRHAYYRHHLSILDLEKSGDDGCDLCQLVVECLKATPEEPDSRGWQPDLKRRICGLEDSLYAAAMQLPTSDVKVCITSDAVYAGRPVEDVSVFDALMIQVGPREEYDEVEGYSGLSPLVLAISTSREDAVYIGDYRIGRFQVESSLGSHANYAITREWLNSCRMSHTTCLSDIIPALPSRVIDVGKIGSSQAPRLFCSHGARAEYVALSHCWGGAISTLLTTETLQAFQNEVPYASLPANFQDAITITRNLEIQYLWIDSLCIIQDSKEDWECESKKMCLVYRDSTVTISAMASPGSVHGILKTAPPTLDHPKRRPMRVFQNTGENFEVTVQWHDAQEEDLCQLDLRGPLNRRGWILQEQVLSPRHLYYGSEQVYWRCPKGFASADGLSGGTGVKTPENAYHQLSPVLYSGILRHAQPAPSDMAAISDDYYALVREYSSRKLSYDSDKLPAFSGLVQRLHPVFGGDYLAGLWSSDLHRGLLWYEEMGACNHVKPYRAPSWSWAVTNDPVLTCDRLPEPGPLDLQLIEYEIAPRNKDNPYGEIVSGHLLVQGFTIPLVRSNQVVDALIPDDCVATIYLDEKWNDGNPELKASSLCLVQGDSGVYLLSVLSTSYGQSPEWEIDFGAFRSESYTALVVCVSDSGIQGLVLQQVDDRSDGAYERIGYFTVHERVKEPYPQMVERLLRQTIKLV